MKDEKLIKLLKSNPEKGMKTLIDLYFPLVSRVIKGKLAPSFCAADIEGCIAETFSEFYLDINKFSSNSGNIRGWLCTIAKNNATDYLRRYYKQASFTEEADGDIADDFSLQGDFEDKNRRELLIKAIKDLGHPDSEIIIRKYFFEQASKDIAKAMNLSVSNVDTRTHRAINKLRSHFGGDFQ